MAPPRLFNVGPRYAAAPTPPIEVERAPAADTLLLGDVALREFAALQREGMRMGSAVFTEVSARDRSASDGMYLKDSVSTTGVYYTGTVRNAASASRADVQSAIDSASNLDIVRLPASSSATWASAVDVGTKAIKLDGNGSTITRGSISDNNPALIFTCHASLITRITNFTFNASTTTNLGYFIKANTSSSDTAAALFRIDNCTFNGEDTGVHIQVFGAGHGLIDNCTFILNTNNEVIQLYGWGSGNTGGWTNDVYSGSDRATYIEDCFVNNLASPNFYGGKTAAFYGARSVIRFCEYHMAQVDQHGTAGSVGARWWEIYNNTFTKSGGDNLPDKWLQIRAGTGMIFSNTTAVSGSGGQIVLWEEDSGYPALYQIGRGKDQALDPCYIWLKDSDMPLGIDEGSANQIVANRDYYLETGSFNGTTGMGVGTIGSRPSTCTAGVAYWATDEGSWRSGYPSSSGRLYKATATNTWTLYYTPYTYPHPLRSSTT